VSEADPYPGPNEEVLEAQARVCTGPHQSRPLGKKEGDPDPKRILELIFASLKGDLPRAEQVSPAQMGAFFAAMSIRRTFGAQTGWSAAEIEAFDRYGDALGEMPEDLRFLLEMAPDFADAGEVRVVEALRSVLQGGHLRYEEVRGALEAMLAGEMRPSLMAAFLIGQRMNIENEEEVRAHLDAVRRPEEALRVQVDSLLHFGQPFDGAARYFRPTLFVAAVRAALGRATVMHGVAEMPPKRGVTEEGVLAALGARVDLSLATAARCIEDPAVGFAYVSQREYAPRAYALRHLRTHIAKRPPWATTEKAQQLFAGAAWNGMIAGFYHAGYEDKLLGLMQERGLDAGLVIKGEEGSSHYGLRLGKPSDARRKAVNYVQGFRRVGGALTTVACDVDPEEYGFCYEQSPRPAEVSARAFADMGLAALQGERGHVYDRIVLNAGLTDYYLGLSASAEEGLAEAREAMDSGRALAHLECYISRSQAAK
jgi:anthranilate phosphoribosyltransferase